MLFSGLSLEIAGKWRNICPRSNTFSKIVPSDWIIQVWFFEGRVLEISTLPHRESAIQRDAGTVSQQRQRERLPYDQLSSWCYF